MATLGVLGTGQVGQAIARRAAEVGYEVTVGARTATSDSLEVFEGSAVRSRRSRRWAPSAPTRCGERWSSTSRTS
jgi:lactate dehydrogenase-like 2-hydroxyacid dehydrogenase